jgi:hypothetical protein
MRSAAAFLAALLIAQPCIAQPLSPGRPAGVKEARLSSWQQAGMITTGALVLIGVGILASGGSGSDALGTQEIPSNQVPISATSSTNTTG